jgi:hypothetical protein
MTHREQRAQAQKGMGRVGKGALTLAGAAALTGAMALLGPVGTAAATSGVYACGTTGFYFAASSLHSAETGKNPGSSCGTYSVRAKYTVTTTGSQYWSGWKHSSTDAVYSTSYGITESQHLTDYSGVRTLYP